MARIFRKNSSLTHLKRNRFACDFRPPVNMARAGKQYINIMAETFEEAVS